MTPFEKLGYKVGDRFYVKREGLEDWGLKENSVVTLTEDDGSENPYFRDENGRMHCFFSDWIEPISLKTEAEKRGAKFGDIGSLKGSAMKFAFLSDTLEKNDFGQALWSVCYKGGEVCHYHPSNIRLDHEPEYREIPFSEATHEQRMVVENLRHVGGRKVEQIFRFNNHSYAFTCEKDEVVYQSTALLKVRIPE